MEIELNTNILRKPAALLLSCTLAASLCPIMPQVAYANSEQSALIEGAESDDNGKLEIAESTALENGADCNGEAHRETVSLGLPSAQEDGQSDVVEKAPSESVASDCDANTDVLVKEGSAETSANTGQVATPSGGNAYVDGIEYFFDIGASGVSITRMVSHKGILDTFMLPTALTLDGKTYTIDEFAWNETSSVTVNKVIVPSGVKVTDLSGLASSGAKALEILPGAILDGNGTTEGYALDAINVGSRAYVNMPFTVSSEESVVVADDAVIATPLMVAEVSLMSTMSDDGRQEGAIVSSDKLENVENNNKLLKLETKEYTYYFTYTATPDTGLIFRGVVEKNPSDSTFYIPSSITVGNDTYPVTKIMWNMVSTKNVRPSTVNENETISATKVVFPGQIETTVITDLTKCTSVEEILFADKANVQCKSMKDVIKFDSPYEVNIGNDCTIGLAFQGSLSKVVIGNNVTLQPGYNSCLFNGCTNLTTVSIGDSDLIQGVFSGCTALSSVEWNKQGQKDVPSGAFKNCQSLKSFDFSAVSSIGTGAFQGTSLSSLVLPASLTKLGSNVFSDCSSLETVEIKSSLPVDSAGNGWFTSCGALKKLKIDSMATFIPTDAFSNAASGMEIDNESKSFTFKPDEVNEKTGVLLGSDGQQIYPYVAPAPGSVIDIGNVQHYFDAQTGKFSIPAATKTIGDGLFNARLFNPEVEGSATVSSIDVDGENTAFVVDGQGILYTADMKELIKAPCGLVEARVPDTVTRIRRDAFKDCTSLTSIVLNEGLKNVGDQAFMNCTKLVSAKLPSTVSHIGNGAFEGAPLSVFIAPENLWVSSEQTDFVEDGGVPSINSLFYGWNYGPIQIYTDKTGGAGVNSIDLSAYSARFIPHYAFAGLAKVAEVVIPSSVELIGSGTFYECRSLNTVYCYAPDSVTINTIGAGHGSSGSGDANESYATTAPGAFSIWNPDIESDSLGIGSKFQDRTGITFYGSAYNKDLISYCDNFNQTFIPIVALQTLSGNDNPFWNKSKSATFSLDYGEGIMTDYGYVQIADIDKGGTPQVLAKFSQYEGTRDLTDDAACAVTYYDSDGNKVTSFDKDGVYTASLVGDGKSVFGARMIKFNVGTVEQPAVEQPATEQPGGSNADDNASETPAATGDAGAETPSTTGAAAQGVRTVYQTTYVPAAAAGAAQDAEAGESNTYAVNDEALPAALEGIAGTDGSVLVWGGSNEASPQYVWEVSGARLTAANIAALDFEVADASKDSAVAGLVGDADFAAFTVKQAGSFPAPFKLHWKTSSTFYDGAKVDVYRVVAASGSTGSASGTPFVEKAYADEGDESLELVKSGVVATDGYVTVDVDRGGTYVLVESGAGVGLPLVEMAYADTGEVVATDVAADAQQASNWMMPAALAAVVAAVVGACGGWFARGRRQDQDTGASPTSGQKR